MFIFFQVILVVFNGSMSVEECAAKNFRVIEELWMGKRLEVISCSLIEVFSLYIYICVCVCVCVGTD